MSTLHLLERRASALLASYRRERFGFVRFGAFAIYLSLAVAAARTPRSFAAFVGLFVVIALSLWAFRLLGDLGERPRDRLAHPDRVLCRATALAPFWIAAGASWVIGIVAAGCWAARRDVAAGLGGLGAVLAVWYFVLLPRLGAHWATTLPPLGKYAVLVDILAERATIVSVQVGLVMVAFEILHDPAVRAGRGAHLTGLVAMIGAALAVLAVQPVAPLRWAAASAMLLVTMAAGRRPGAGAGYALFLASAASWVGTWS